MPTSSFAIGVSSSIVSLTVIRLHMIDFWGMNIMACDFVMARDF